MVDLSELFGEAWCVTLTQFQPAEALERMGVGEVAEVKDGLDLVTERLEAMIATQSVLLLGRRLSASWSLIVELEGTLGWSGMEREMLAQLSGNGQRAVSAFADPNQTMVHAAADGEVVWELDVISGRVIHEADAEGEMRGLLSLGFSREGEPTGQVASADEAERLALALGAVTGVELEEEDFDSCWLGGLRAAG